MFIKYINAKSFIIIPLMLNQQLYQLYCLYGDKIIYQLCICCVSELNFLNLAYRFKLFIYFTDSCNNIKNIRNSEWKFNSISQPSRPSFIESFSFVLEVEKNISRNIFEISRQFKHLLIQRIHHRIFINGYNYVPMI